MDSSSIKIALASLSARRAWIEISNSSVRAGSYKDVALRKESVDRNVGHVLGKPCTGRRSPQGERG